MILFGPSTRQPRCVWHSWVMQDNVGQLECADLFLVGQAGNYCRSRYELGLPSTHGTDETAQTWSQ